MAWSSTFNPPRQRDFLFSPSFCKFHSSFLPFEFHLSCHPFAFSSPKYTLKPKLSLSAVNLSTIDTSSARTPNNISSEELTNFRTSRKFSSRFSSCRSNDKRVESKIAKSSDTSVLEETFGKGFVGNGQSRRKFDTEKRIQSGSRFSSLKSRDKDSAIREVVDGKIKGSSEGGENCISVVEVNKREKGPEKSKDDAHGATLRIGLDRCSKRGDVMAAISLFDSAVRDGIKMGQYHYTVLLYLCSSAAIGVIWPAKSGSGSRSLDMLAPSTDMTSVGSDGGSGDDDDEEEEDPEDVKDQSRKEEVVEILVGEDVKKYALEKGFEIYEKMCSENVPMNEAALTSVARMAMAMGDGDMAFNMVKRMKELGINPKLRSYGPALSAFCNSGQIEKAFAVEKHMLEHGIHPEEPELEALLRVSIEVGKAEKVYYLLHKLRANVRAVSPSTANLIERWFKSKEASQVGKKRWDQKMILQVMENVGGGWHGKGWLSRGKWTVSHTSVESDGLCKHCGEKLVTIDLDPEETGRFAKSVASIATKKERNSSFEKFQRWLDYYGPFEAVVDAANVGLFSQKRFKTSKVNAVVNGIRQMLPSRKWPLIVLHNRRVTGCKMDKPINKALIEKWRNADALYLTPTGSNDDWYWLYAAIKFKGLIVTNDEMRDHTFQLLGNDLFPIWKERHQVRFSFSDVGPVFHMPPPCSVVIQESERGHWHIPVVLEDTTKGKRAWLCITRPNSQNLEQSPRNRSQDPGKLEDDQECKSTKSQTELLVKSPTMARGKRKPGKPAEESYPDLRTIPAASACSTNHRSVLTDIQEAEKLGRCVIDFQI
ncbi:hypothetical protein Ancab_028753 [Ancistrocladus abbreviatus]